MKDAIAVEIHILKPKPRPVSLEEYRAGQEEINKRLDCIARILDSMRQGVKV